MNKVKNRFAVNITLIDVGLIHVRIPNGIYFAQANICQTELLRINLLPKEIRERIRKIERSLD